MLTTLHFNNDLIGGNDLTDIIKKCNGISTIDDIFVRPASGFLGDIKSRKFTLSSTDSDSYSDASRGSSSPFSKKALQAGREKLKKTKKKKEKNEEIVHTDSSEDKVDEFSDPNPIFEEKQTNIEKVKDILLAIGYTDNEEDQDKTKYYLNAFNKVVVMAQLMSELKDSLLEKGYTENQTDTNFYLKANQKDLEQAFKDTETNYNKIKSKLNPDVNVMRDNIKKAILLKHYLLNRGKNENPFDTYYFYLNTNIIIINELFFNFKHQDLLVDNFGYTKNPEDASYYMEATIEDVDKIKEQENLIIRKEEVKNFLLLIGFTKNPEDANYYMKAEETDLEKAEQDKMKYKAPLKLLYPEKQISQLTSEQIEYVKKREDIKDRLLKKGFGDRDITPRKVKDPANPLREIKDPDHKEYYLFANDSIIDEINEEIRQEEERKKREVEEKDREKQIQKEKERKEKLIKIKDLLVSYYEYSEDESADNSYLKATDGHISWIIKREEHKDVLLRNYRKNEDPSSKDYYLKTIQIFIDQIEKAESSNLIRSGIVNRRKHLDYDSDSDDEDDKEWLDGGGIRYKVKYN